MTTLIVIDGHHTGETRSKAVARRLRSELAARSINGSEAARRCRRSQPWMSRRINGTTAFTVDELDHVCAVLGMSYNYIATGIKEVPPPNPDGPDGGVQLPRLDSNQQPSDYWFQLAA